MANTSSGRTARLNVRVTERNKMRIHDQCLYEAGGPLSEAAFVDRLLTEAFEARENRAVERAVERAEVKKK